MTSPADELRAAAEKLRDAAELAGGQTWVADHYPEGTIVRPATSTRSLFRLAADGTRAAGTPNVAAPIGEYIAAMHPGVGIALADWLEFTATVLDANTHPGWQETVASQPLAVVRAINGGQP